MASMMAIPSNTVRIGLWLVQASPTGVPGAVFPKSSLAACTSADTGFHSANTRRGVGRVSEGTNALEMNVRGKSTKNETLACAAGRQP